MPIDALSVLCAQLTHDLLAIAKFLFIKVLQIRARVHVSKRVKVVFRYVR